MIVGAPKEIKVHEYRVGLTPGAARELGAHGHRVMIERGAGAAIGLTDEMYAAAGAEIVDAAAEIFAHADLVVKVKEPQPGEVAMLREGQTLFTYLHLAPDHAQAQGLLRSGCVAIAYETVTDARGGLPLLAPMSEVAGRMAVQAGAHCLEVTQGGRGVLLGGVPGVPAARVTIIGGGVVGANAARMAMGLGAQVTVIDKSQPRLAELDLMLGAHLNTIYSTREALEEHVLGADLVIGAVLVPGAEAPRLITREMVSRMKPGSVIVDVAIDQGGCAETSRPTTHAEPTFKVDGVVHYCVANMPGGVARTSTFALGNATLPFVLQLADKGPTQAMRDNPHLKAGLNVHRGRIAYAAVAEAQGLAFVSADAALSG